MESHLSTATDSERSEKCKFIQIGEFASEFTATRAHAEVIKQLLIKLIISSNFLYKNCRFHRISHTTTIKIPNDVTELFF